MGKLRPDIFAGAERLMGMNDAVWAAHCNPKSVYSRFTVLPLITLAVWSRLWLEWAALIPVIISLIWAWWNPRAFGPPKHTDSWAARGTFGERVFLNRKTLPIPRHHLVWAQGLTWVCAVGFAPWAYGVWTFSIWPTILGLVLIVGGKVWFVDRMVWVYQDMKDQDATYASWLR